MPSKIQRKRAMRKEQHQRSVRSKSPLKDCGHPPNVQNAVKTNNDDVLNSDHALIVSPTRHGFSISQTSLGISSLSVIPSSSMEGAFSSSRTRITNDSVSSETFEKIRRLNDTNVDCIDNDFDNSSRASSICSSKKRGRPKRGGQGGRPDGNLPNPQYLNENPILSAHHNKISSSNFSTFSQNTSPLLTPNFSISPPLTPFSITSEKTAPREMRNMSESSFDTESLISIESSSVCSSRPSSPNNSFASKRGRPKKKLRTGRPKKQTSLQPQVPMVPTINFENLPLLNFSTQQTNDPGAICNRAFMALRDEDNDRAPFV
uniref:Uncharacterized protein n=1 Tax=Meloidogyne enterolobii TaxID=390850 RepID=A0A6V7VX58_MELEN|nr:unnamed protein product [Meloidogyne enterolobii]